MTAMGLTRLRSTWIACGGLRHLRPAKLSMSMSARLKSISTLLR